MGAGLGGLCRYAVNLWAWQPDWLPIAASTLCVNVAGGLGAGLLFGLFGMVWLKSHVWGLFLMTGFLGGFTTFSAFTAEGLVLLGQKPLLALLHAIVHVVGCLGFFYIGNRMGVLWR
ncbi:MAG: fluoride efflux transporter CrcB [Limnobacter sp.]|nr:fluoride efflux transporter CrcB [Limnobacter sp.]